MKNLLTCVVVAAAALIAACGGDARRSQAPDSAAMVTRAVAAIGAAWPNPLPADVSAFVRDSSGYVVDLVPRARVEMGRYRVHFTSAGRVVRWEMVGR